MKRWLIILFVFSLQLPVPAQLQVTRLRCEYRNNPLGVENARPYLSWELQSTALNVLQTAYRIVVAEDSSQLAKKLALTWDSRKRTGSASVNVTYNGKELMPAKKYYWKVQVWDNKGHTAESEVASWQMGLPANRDWANAQWIGYDEPADSLRIFPLVHLNGKRSWGPRRNVLPLMRKEFDVKKPIRSATAFICGLGHFDMYLNGKKTGDHFLDPGWTNYAKQAQYVSFDITDAIRQGKNAVGVMLGNGFYYIPGQRYRKMTGAYGHPKMIMRMVIDYADGSVEDIITDKSWTTAPSPIIFSSIFGGEDYDAGREQEGWSRPGFPGGSRNDWVNAIITNGPAQLQSQMQEPVKIMQRFVVVSSREREEGVKVYDLGQNFSGIPAIQVRGNKGDTIRVFCAELLNGDGTANQRATGSPSYFTYILKGGESESWQPSFSYTGFRYMQVHCIPKDSGAVLPVVTHIEGLHIRNAFPQTGSFTCSNELFNKTGSLIDWAVKSNTVSVFTDCPHREKLGWLEQTHLMGASIQYNYDIAALNRKLVMDMINAQHEDGKMPEIAPEFTQFTPPFDESPEWGSAAIILPWYHYQWYGDLQSLEKAYPMMQRYLGYLLTKDSAFILKHGLGDWFDIGPKKSGFAQMTKMGITATAILYYDLTILTDIATLLKKPADIKKYRTLAVKVKKAFNSTFFNKQTLQYDSASQTANAMALYMGLVDPLYKNAVVDALVKDIQNRNNSLTAGDIGFRYVVKALEEAGRSDLLFTMNSRDDVPGYGFQLKHGATALTESWQAYESVSNNHLMLGHLMEWFYAALGGIQLPRGTTGYTTISLKPQPVGDLNYVKASCHTIYGEVVSEWWRTGDRFEWKVTIPVNTSANLYLPGSAKPIRTGSGTYRYNIKLK